MLHTLSGIYWELIQNESDSAGSDSFISYLPTSVLKNSMQTEVKIGLLLMLKDIKVHSFSSASCKERVERGRCNTK